MTKDEALARLQSQCSLREVCKSEAEDKMRKWKANAGDFAEIISSLEAAGYINELRYAEAFVHDKSKLAKWGSVKIKQALAAKKIPANIIAEVLKNIDKESAQTVICDLVAKKLKTVKPQDTRKTFASLMRFGASRGFEYDDVYNAVKKALAEQSDIE